MIPHVQEGFPLDELWRRYSAERLTPRQADRLLKTSLEVPDHFLARQNYPCDSPSTVYAAFRLHAPEEWDVGIVLSELHVDGRRLNGPFEPLQSGSYPGRTRQWEPISNARIPALPPGRHTALLVLTVRLRPSDEDSPILLDPPEVEVRIPGDFVVQEKRLADFTKGIYTPELARQVADSISISLDRTPQGLRRQLVVTANGLWGVFGQFEIRAEGQERFQAISDYGLGSPSGELFSYWHAEDMNGPLPQTARIDLRLVPDPTYAFEVNAKEYFDGIIEWKDVPVHTGRPIEARWPTIDPHGQVKPTRVFPVHPNKVGQSFSR